MTPFVIALAPVITTCVAILIGWAFLLTEYRRAGATLLSLAVAIGLPFTLVPVFLAVSLFHRVPDSWVWLKTLEVCAVLGLLAYPTSLYWPESGDRQSCWAPPRPAGTADKALRKLLLGSRAEQCVFLGVANRGKRIVVTDQERESHMQIVGPTRSGKSQLLFALSGQDMRREMPVFFMEAKGDRSDFDQFLKLADLTGRKADVRYFNPQDPRSMTFNPIRPLPGQDVLAITNQLARAIGREPTSSGEAQDYYRSLDYARMLNMVEVFCATGLEFTLKDCFHYFNSEKARNKAFDLCKDAGKVHIASDDFKRSSDTVSLTSAIRPWTIGGLGKLLNDYAPQINLEDIFEQRQLAYFAIPIGHLQVLANPLGRMLISGLLSVAAARQKLHPKPPAASVILDEFSEFATPAFASFIATVGSARFWTVLSHQDLGQLKRIEGMSPEAFHSAVFANTSGCKVCFRVPAPEDAEFWAAMVGTFTTVKDTRQVQEGLLWNSSTGQLSRRDVEEFKVHPNLLKNLLPGTALIYSPARLECLARTARAAPLLTDRQVPELPPPIIEQKRGLELESEAMSGPKFDTDGRLTR